MKLTQLEYILPSNLIANAPSVPRDHAKLLTIEKNTGEISHQHFYDLPEILGKNDVLVFNETKVFPARLFATNKNGKKIEVLLLREIENNTWTAMHKGKVIVKDILDFNKVKAEIIDKSGYEITIKFNSDRNQVLNNIEENGHTPLPPYINSNTNEKDLREDYQTVYAKHEGSVAAPTAGLHFTTDLIQKLKDKGVQVEYVTLHVGAGTFLPIKTDEVTEHPMHSEYFSVKKDTINSLNKAKSEGKRIIAVGTTTTRVLETLSSDNGILDINKLSGSTDIFIYAPYKFKFVDSLITNFHLPHSTLLALVSAFVSEPNTEHSFTSFKESVVGKAYEEAIKNNYKFYSFGDGSLIY